MSELVLLTILGVVLGFACVLTAVRLMRGHWLDYTLFRFWGTAVLAGIGGLIWLFTIISLPYRLS